MNRDSLTDCHEREVLQLHSTHRPGHYPQYQCCVLAYRCHQYYVICTIISTISTGDSWLCLMNWRYVAISKNARTVRDSNPRWCDPLLLSGQVH